MGQRTELLVSGTGGYRCAASPWLSPQLFNRLRQHYQPPKVAVPVQFQEGNLLPWRAWLFSPIYLHVCVTLFVLA